MKAKIRDTEIYFDVMGEQLSRAGAGFYKKPVVLLLHGGPGGDHTCFKSYCPELAQVAQLIMLDHRGCGRSKRGNPKSYTLENNVEDLEVFRQYLGLDKVILYGHSYGGSLAQAYACKYPDNIAKLILGVTACDGSFIAAARKNLRERGNEKQRAWEQVLFERGFENNDELRQYFIDLMPLYSNKARTEGASVEAFDNMILSYEAINNGFLDFLLKMDFTSQLPELKMPTLVFGGRDDWICPIEYSEKMAKLIPNAKLVVFEQSGHSVPLDEHDAYIEMLSQFVKI
ncbi:MAG: alpha/beta fold hydrolase [Gammaproteobacteria bacterium]|nr:alpha/beta fold hydrolase [Gammaproteobacteria bacterium]MCH9744257.1 alpha/beta fold hydrolase [Gammaproteobacteria bacterium]